MSNTIISEATMRNLGIVGALASISGLGATLADIVAPTVGWAILILGLALLGFPLSSRILGWVRKIRASRILMVTAKVDNLDIWRSSDDRDGVTARDLIQVALSKPRFAFLVVRNDGRKHLDHVIKEVTVAGNREIRLGQWVEEYTGEFLPHEPDGISLKVGAERLLLLGVAFPDQDAKRWFRVNSSIPKRHYTGYDRAIFNNEREFKESPVTIKVRLQEAGLDLPAEITIGFNGEGVPCLIGKR